MKEPGNEKASKGGPDEVGRAGCIHGWSPHRRWGHRGGHEEAQEIKVCREGWLVRMEISPEGSGGSSSVS